VYMVEVSRSVFCTPKKVPRPSLAVHRRGRVRKGEKNLSEEAQ